MKTNNWFSKSYFKSFCFKQKCFQNNISWKMTIGKFMFEILNFLVHCWVLPESLFWSAIIIIFKFNQQTLSCILIIKDASLSSGGDYYSGEFGTHLFLFWLEYFHHSIKSLFIFNYLTYGIVDWKYIWD
jgi:hypothetical protein